MNVLRIAYLLVLVFAASFIIGCNRGTNDPSSSKATADQTRSGLPGLVLRDATSPAGPDSREPELYATADGQVILSWVEKIGASRYALRFAKQDAAGWSEARKVAEGDNWFVNWADFPSVIALRDGSLAAHWLVKSGSGTYAYDINISLSKDDAGVLAGKMSRVSSRLGPNGTSSTQFNSARALALPPTNQST